MVARTKSEGESHQTAIKTYRQTHPAPDLQFHGWQVHSYRSKRLQLKKKKKKISLHSMMGVWQKSQNHVPPAMLWGLTGPLSQSDKNANVSKKNARTIQNTSQINLFGKKKIRYNLTSNDVSLRTPLPLNNPTIIGGPLHFIEQLQKWICTFSKCSDMGTSTYPRKSFN